MQIKKCDHSSPLIPTCGYTSIKKRENISGKHNLIMKSIYAEGCGVRSQHGSECFLFHAAHQLAPSRTAADVFIHNHPVIN